jgi:hypothetical protein
MTVVTNDSELAAMVSQEFDFAETDHPAGELFAAQRRPNPKLGAPVFQLLGHHGAPLVHSKKWADVGTGLAMILRLRKHAVRTAMPCFRLAMLRKGGEAVLAPVSVFGRLPQLQRRLGPLGVNVEPSNFVCVDVSSPRPSALIASGTRADLGLEVVPLVGVVTSTSEENTARFLASQNRVVNETSLLAAVCIGAETPSIRATQDLTGIVEAVRNQWDPK